MVIAFLFARLTLLSLASAGRNGTLSATIFLPGGIVGTLHHLYFSGTPTMVLARGSVFSALEVVPLLFVGQPAALRLLEPERRAAGDGRHQPAAGRSDADVGGS